MFAAEVNSDALATVEPMGEATQRIQIASWVADIYLRHPYVCAQPSAVVDELARDVPRTPTKLSWRGCSPPGR